MGDTPFRLAGARRHANVREHPRWKTSDQIWVWLDGVGRHISGLEERLAFGTLINAGHWHGQGL